MLSPVTKAASIQKHCVRCHDTFYENQNHSAACNINHNEYANTDRAETGDDALESVLACCYLTYNPEEDSFDGKPGCIVEAHTTNPKDVAYFDGDQEEGNENVITCAERGCIQAKRRGALTNEGQKAAKKKK